MSRKQLENSRPGKLSGAPRPTVLLGLFFEDGSPEIMAGILDAAHDYGWQLLNLSCFDGFLPPFVHPQGILDEHIAGDSEVEELRADGCPVVRLGTLPHPQDYLLPAVLPDFYAAGQMAAAHLSERGFTDLGFVGYQNNDSARFMWEGFRQQANELGCASDHLLLDGRPYAPGASRQEYLRRCQQEWLESRPKPFGVFTYSDIRAGQICTGCLASGISVPEEVAILSYGNKVHQCETSPIQLSSIDANREFYGREAARLLHRLMNGEPPPTEPVMIPPNGVVQRQSTDILAVPHPLVAKALRFIWDNFEQQLSVNDIARRVGVSRSGLDRAFRRHLGRTVNAEVSRKRLERCAELLRNTDLAVGDIAAITGFATETYLYRIFRKEHDMTPRDYRKQSRKSND